MWTDSRMTGYRYSRNDKNIYIIKLMCSNEKKDLIRNCYFGLNCICEQITNINTGETVKSALLKGKMDKYVYYEVGSVIPGVCWYCHSIEDLFTKGFLKKGEDGEISDRKIPVNLYDKLEIYIKDNDLEISEVAEELETTESELIKEINSIKRLQAQDEKKNRGQIIVNAVGTICRKQEKDGKRKSFSDKLDEYMSEWDRLVIEDKKSR